MQRPVIYRLLESTSNEKIEEIITMELSTEEGNVDFYYIGELMDEYELKVVGPTFSTYVIEKYWRQFGVREDQLPLIKALCALDEFNVLHLNCYEYEPDDSKVAFAVSEF